MSIRRKEVDILKSALKRLRGRDFWEEIMGGGGKEDSKDVLKWKI